MIRAAIALVALTYAAALAPAVPSDPLPITDLWSLIEVRAGQEYVVDYNLTDDDCWNAMLARPRSGCHRQP